MRDWLPFEYIRDIPTPFGPIDVVITDGGHCHVMPAESLPRKVITVNGCALSLSLHLFGPDWTPKDYNSLYSRKQDAPYGKDNLSDSMRKKILDKIPAIVRQYLDAVPQLLVKAECASINNDLHNLEKEEAELNGKILENRGKQSELHSKLATLRGNA